MECARGVMMPRMAGQARRARAARKARRPALSRVALFSLVPLVAECHRPLTIYAFHYMDH